VASKTSPIPGPIAESFIKRDKKYLSPSYTRSYPAVIEKGEGSWVWDVDGNKFLDFNAGIAVCATGHCHPEVVKAIKTQADSLLHISGTDYYQPRQVELAEKLAEIVPGPKNKRSFFSNSGAEAIEAAMKLSRYHTQRKYFISFFDSFHGRTLGALSLTGSKQVQRRRFGPLLSGVVHLPYGYCYRCAYNLHYPECNFACIRYIEDEVFRTILPAEEVAAIFVEPIQGEGGYVIPPDGWLSELHKLCAKYEILLVADEVQSGMGRTGRMFASEHSGVIADIYCLAKGIASGMPLGATVARSSIMDWPPGAHASTFGGNPVSCAAALTTIRLLEEGLIENARRMGELLLTGLESLRERYEFIGDIRGKGLMIGIELVRDPKTKEFATERRNSVVVEAFRQGLILQGCGPSVIRFSPPLVVSREECMMALSRFEAALKKVFRA
jgi:4-aminobutyrate aminotransferase